MRTRDLAAELLESLPDPVIGCDTGGTIVYWSRAAEEAYGYPTAEALGRRARSSAARGKGAVEHPRELLGLVGTRSGSARTPPTGCSPERPM